jgi:peptidyl-prolyl cis-trans isomerase C
MITIPIARPRLALIAFMLVMLLATSAMSQTEIQAEKPAAVVNTIDITVNELHSELKKLSVEMDLRNRPLSAEQISSLKQQLLETLIERELLYQQAQQRKIEVRNRWIERALDELKARLAEHAMTLQDYLEKTGLAEDQLRNGIRKGLIVQRMLRREVIRQIKISEAEMQSFYQQHPDFFKRDEQIRIRHILVSVSPAADEEKKADALLRIQTIQTKLREGQDFGVLALENSDCPSKNRGGDLGYLTRGEIIPAVSRAAFDLQPGQISDIITTRYGFDLVQVLDHRPPTQMAYKNTRDKIERTLRRDKEKAAAHTYLAKLKKNAVIKRYALP